jgi:hypothetical protein
MDVRRVAAGTTPLAREMVSGGNEKTAVTVTANVVTSGNW